MTADALSLAPDVVAAQTATVARDPWLARRLHGWGASEVAALLLAYDPRDVEIRTAYVRHGHEAAIGRAGFPRIVCRKAGLLTYPKHTGGGERERELVERWAREAGYDAVQHASAAPREWMPLVDRECPLVTATPDGWCRGPSDELIAVEAKCLPKSPPSVLPWYWRVQLQAQIACMAAEAGVLVCGPRWVLGSDEAPVSWLVERDDEEIARIRRVAVRAWDDVERLRASRKAA